MKVTDKISGFDILKKDDYLYLDGLHKIHLEVFNKKGNIQSVLNLDGRINIKKTAASLKEGRRINL
ncbi:hypothetical protein ABMA77_14105 [Halobacteriovorax sp. RZ-1]|uniref:hypothetical protein n=1 Tax=unclassified Halobacteriovorax TaxID=2639665 RepID=UPI0037211721